MEKLNRKIFCNTASEETIQYILKQELLSEPLCLAFEKYNWDNFPTIIPQTYIVLIEDKTISVKKQRNMMKNLGIKNMIEIKSDHMVMLSHPEELSNELNKIMGEV
ncbi:MAG: hypothetical protein JXB88_12300 [Spirochaetales bacterium]|nr:hypothetical protein [Spirochaetales bacterium]